MHPYSTTLSVNGANRVLGENRKLKQVNCLNTSESPDDSPLDPKPILQLLVTRLAVVINELITRIYNKF